MILESLSSNILSPILS